MTGIEKITARIQADAQQEIDAVLAEANSQAADIDARYAAQAKQAEAEILEKGQQSAAELRQRLNSNAQMDAKKQELAAKQALLDEAFQLAYEKLTQLPEGEYEDLLANLAVRASTSGTADLLPGRSRHLRRQSHRQSQRPAGQGGQDGGADPVPQRGRLPGRPAHLRRRRGSELHLRDPGTDGPQRDRGRRDQGALRVTRSCHKEGRKIV